MDEITNCITLEWHGPSAKYPGWSIIWKRALERIEDIYVSSLKMVYYVGILFTMYILLETQNPRRLMIIWDDNMRGIYLQKELGW